MPSGSGQLLGKRIEFLVPTLSITSNEPRSSLQVPSASTHSSPCGPVAIGWEEPQLATGWVEERSDDFRLDPICAIEGALCCQFAVPNEYQIDTVDTDEFSQVSDL